MPKYSSQKATEIIGSRYDLVLIAAVRARELNRRHLPKVQNATGSVVTALREIEAGLIGRDYLLKVERNQSPLA